MACYAEDMMPRYEETKSSSSSRFSAKRTFDSLFKTFVGLSTTRGNRLVSVAATGTGDVEFSEEGGKPVTATLVGFLRILDFSSREIALALLSTFIRDLNRQHRHRILSSGDELVSVAPSLGRDGYVRYDVRQVSSDLAGSSAIVSSEVPLWTLLRLLE